jgi:hypothetical protein
MTTVIDLAVAWNEIQILFGFGDDNSAFDPQRVIVLVSGVTIFDGQAQSFIEKLSASGGVK